MEYFDALAQTLHFGRAAELAGVSQPALSTQIAEMEERLGCRLFERGGKAVRLTDEALALQPRIERVLAELREIERVATAGAARHGRPLPARHHPDGRALSAAAGAAGDTRALSPSCSSNCARR